MPFTFADADLQIVSSDGISFFVHKSRMARNSHVFADMFDLPAPVTKDSSSSTLSEIACVDLTESSTTLEDLLHFVYQTEKVDPATMLLFKRVQHYTSPLEEFQRFSSLFEASCKYEIDPAQQACAKALHSLLSHRALRAPIEDLASRLDHPDLAVEARHYEDIQLNKRLRAAAMWRNQSRGYMWQFWALCWLLAVAASVKLAVSLHIHMSLRQYIYPICDSHEGCTNEPNLEFKLSTLAACISLFLAPVYCCFVVASQPIDRSLLRSLISLAWGCWFLDCVHNTLHFFSSQGNCDTLSRRNPEYFADCLLTTSSASSLALSYLCLSLCSPQFGSVLYWVAAVLYQQWLFLESIPRRSVSTLHPFPELKSRIKKST